MAQHTKRVLFIQRYRRALQWVTDLLEGEMIEAPRHGYTKTHLGFEVITESDLSVLAYDLTKILKGTGLVITWSMGELIPLWRKP